METLSDSSCREKDIMQSTKEVDVSVSSLILDWELAILESLLSMDLLAIVAFYYLSI